MAEEQKEAVQEQQDKQENQEEQPKKKSNLLIIVILVLVVVLGVVGGFLILNSGEKEPEEEIKEEVIVPTVFFEVPEIVVSLSGNTSNIRYLKLVISFELAAEIDKASIEALMPKIIDEYQIYLRQLRLEDLRGSVGTYRLKESLLLRVNQVAQPVQVKNVLIKEMLIQ